MESWRFVAESPLFHACRTIHCCSIESRLSTVQAVGLDIWTTAESVEVGAVPFNNVVTGLFSLSFERKALAGFFFLARSTCILLFFLTMLQANLMLPVQYMDAACWG